MNRQKRKLRVHLPFRIIRATCAITTGSSFCIPQKWGNPSPDSLHRERSVRFGMILGSGYTVAQSQDHGLKPLLPSQFSRRYPLQSSSVLLSKASVLVRIRQHISVSNQPSFSTRRNLSNNFFRTSESKACTLELAPHASDFGIFHVTTRVGSLSHHWPTCPCLTGRW